MVKRKVMTTRMVFMTLHDDIEVRLTTVAADDEEDHTQNSNEDEGDVE